MTTPALTADQLAIVEHFGIHKQIHYVAVDLELNDAGVHVLVDRFICEGTPADTCHQWPDCEHEDGWDHTAGPIVDGEPEGAPHTCPNEPHDGCLYVEYWGNNPMDGWSEFDVEAPLLSGRYPVHTWWENQDESYWSLIDPDALAAFNADDVNG